MPKLLKKPSKSLWMGKINHRLNISRVSIQCNNNNPVHILWGKGNYMICDPPMLILLMRNIYLNSPFKVSSLCGINAGTFIYGILWLRIVDFYSSFPGEYYSLILHAPFLCSFLFSYFFPEAFLASFHLPTHKMNAQELSLNFI